MENEKLLPCPMCAGEGEAVCMRIGEDAVASWVRCLSCGLRTAEIEDAYSDLPSAIAAWNTRAPADLRSALEAETIERCAKVVEEHGVAWGLSYRSMTDNLARATRALAPTKGDVS